MGQKVGTVCLQRVYRRWCMLFAGPWLFIAVVGYIKYASNIHYIGGGSDGTLFESLRVLSSMDSSRIVIKRKATTFSMPPIKCYVIVTTLTCLTASSRSSDLLTMLGRCEM